MPVWMPKDLTEEPELVLFDWQIVEIDFGTRHFIGHSRATYEGRVSSDIVTFDRAKQTGVTRSGRVYRLEGPPLPGGLFNEDAGYVQDIWMRRNDVKSFEVVTGQGLQGE